MLVRYNPEGDVELNKRQNERHARLSRWLREHEHKLLFELLAPPTTEQLDATKTLRPMTKNCGHLSSLR